MKKLLALSLVALLAGVTPAIHAAGASTVHGAELLRSKHSGIKSAHKSSRKLARKEARAHKQSKKTGKRRLKHKAV